MSVFSFDTHRFPKYSKASYKNLTKIIKYFSPGDEICILFIISLIYNNMKFRSLFLPVLLCCLAGCTDSIEEPKPALEIKSVQIDARSYSDWVYFSFDKGEVVTINPTTFSTDLSWDIAFHRNDVRLNCGASGKEPAAH